MKIKKKIKVILSQVRKMQPLVHHLTNPVTINDCANVVLALGGSPVMASALEEVEEMVEHAAALVLNLGTLDEKILLAMHLAGKRANQRGIPVVLDPVGVGSTKFRKQGAKALLKNIKVAVIRGNAGEIKRLAGLGGQLQGVDSLEEREDFHAAQRLAQEWNCVVAMTGKRDVIASPDKLAFIDNGHPLLRRITGSGCMTTSLVATCCGVTADYFAAGITAVACMALAGEKAAGSLKIGEGPGTFRMRLLDHIYGLTPEDLESKLKLSVPAG